MVASGDRLAFVSAVWPDCTTDACNAAKGQGKADNKVKAHVADKLMFRHWNAWDEGTRSHLFVVGADGDAPRDLTPGAKYDVPPGPFGGSEGYAFSPDGREIAYTAKDQGRTEAWTTDVNLYVVSRRRGAPTVITKANKGADQNPVYSPDGKYIAYASQARAGFESDRFRLMLYDRADEDLARAAAARGIGTPTATSGRRTCSAVYVATTDAGRDKLYRVDVRRGDGVATRRSGARDRRSQQHRRSRSSRDGKNGGLDARRHRIARRGLLAASLTARGRRTRVRSRTRTTRSSRSSRSNPAEDFWFKGAGGDSVQGFIVKPPQVARLARSIR